MFTVEQRLGNHFPATTMKEALLGSKLLKAVSAATEIEGHLIVRHRDLNSDRLKVKRVVIHS